jgi:hypothetical protein
MRVDLPPILAFPRKGGRNLNIALGYLVNLFATSIRQIAATRVSPRRR